MDRKIGTKGPTQATISLHVFTSTFFSISKHFDFGFIKRQRCQVIIVIRIDSQLIYLAKQTLKKGIGGKKNYHLSGPLRELDTFC